MRRADRALLVLALGLVVLPSVAHAGWSLVPAGRVATVGSMSVTPQTDWNAAGRAPGKQGATWTHDGFELNRLDLLAGIPGGQPIFRTRNRKRNPQPAFDSALQQLDLADLFERSFRIAAKTAAFAIDRIVPARLGNQPAVEVRYHYSLPDDDLVHRGLARLAIVRRQLYLANFTAADLHYFAAGEPEARAIMDGARIQNVPTSDGATARSLPSKAAVTAIPAVSTTPTASAQPCAQHPAPRPLACRAG